MMFSDFFQFWQNLPLLVNPVFFSIGSFSFRWYSFSYLAAFLTVYLLLKWRIKRKESPVLHYQTLDLFMLYAIVGLLIGARFGYVIFYDLSYFLDHPFSIIWPFSGENFVGLSGMSFHGGLLGTTLASVFFAKKNKISLLSLTDFVIPAVPLGYFWGRIGNFLNGELFGRITENPWGMRFPSDQTNLLRHPSQLYEAFFEGLFIFVILWPLRNHPKLKHQFLGLYLILYGTIRFLIEFLRQPDIQLGFVLWHLTLGQLLSLMMIVIGTILIFLIRSKQNENSSH